MNDVVEIENEAAMAHCAALLASQLHGGECILLSGTLGMGKTAFARGLIRQLCGQEVEVVSPTFMLVQHYDALPQHGGFPVHHYDLYRLERAEDLWELGLDEALGHVLVLAEWPEIASGYWPGDRMEITIEPGAEGSESRRLQVAAHGAMVGTAQQFITLWNAHARD